MIVKMLKVYMASRSEDRERLLESVAALGALHLVPVDPRRVMTDEKLTSRINNLERAVQVFANLAPSGPLPDQPKDAIAAPAPSAGADQSADAAAQTVLNIQQRTAERQNRLIKLHRQLEQLSLWGDVQLRQFDQLRDAGVDVQLVSLPTRDGGNIEADCVEVLGTLPAKRQFVAVINRRGEPTLPDEAVAIPLPIVDAPSIRAEAAAIDAGSKQDARHLATLAQRRPAMEAELASLRQEADYTRALHGALGSESLFALQGWAPAEGARSLAADLADRGIAAAVSTLDPEPGEEPPTLIRPPRWAASIRGLFKILGTVAGYREFDVSTPFMIALPIFAAILISDGGYGALLFLVPLLFYRRLSMKLGGPFTRLLTIIGAVALGWGFLCGSFFGLTPYAPPIPVDLTEQARTLLMRISFTMGAIHMSLAQLWGAVSLYPDLRFLNRVGWGIFIWGMLGVVQMFVLKGPMGWSTPWPYLLIGGGVLAVCFGHPSRNIAKMLGMGLADFPLSMLSAFSNVISYVRLMAVGLASAVLARSFNDLADGTGTWLAAVPILLFGHGLTFALGLVALFAHGVRLNMLEFCSNLGMQWTGYPYQPFVNRTIKEN